MRNVAIGYCHNGMVHQPFLSALISFLHWDGTHREYFAGLIDAGGLYIDDNRNRLAEKFLELNLEWLLMCDTDIIMPPDALDLLMDATSRERRIISALYFSRMDGKTTMPVWLMRDADNEYTNLPRIALNEVQQVAAVGMGCCLIHREVFERVAERHIDDPWRWFSRDIGSYYGKPQRLGEDISFCKRAEEAGFSVWGHGGVPVQHIKSRLENFDSFIGQLSPTTQAQIREVMNGGQPSVPTIP